MDIKKDRYNMIENDIKDICIKTKLNYYGNVKYNTSIYDISLWDWMTKYPSKYKDKIEYIRSINDTDPKRAKELKSSLLPCCTITGRFNGYRNMNNLTGINPFICIDIDSGDNPDIKDWTEVKNKIMKWEYIFYCSLSCRGEGVFCLIYWDVNKDFKKVWYALERDFKDKFGIVIDKNCKDLTRLRFISYDKNTLMRNKLVMYSDEYDKEKEWSQCEYSDILNEDEEFIFNAIKHLFSECGYRADNYSDWLMDGFRLGTFGEYGKILFMYLSQLSDNYDEISALKKFEECQKSTKKNRGCLRYYLGQLKKYYGPDWKNIIDKNIN